MNVPPYVPPPIELPRNVGDGPYRERVAFVRRVSLIFFLSLLAIGALSRLDWPDVPVGVVLVALLVALLGLSFVRWLARGRHPVWESPLDESTELPNVPVHHSAAGVSLLLAVPVLVLWGWLTFLLRSYGWPVEAVLAGQGLATLYAWVSGRDLSFLAMFALPCVGSTLLLIGWGLWVAWPLPNLLAALVLNAVLLLYKVYDLAMLLSRRRFGEEAVAAVDLYRDVLNVASYTVRCVQHWKKYGPWAR